MPFSTCLSLLIEFTENRPLILSRQSEAWAFYVHGQPVEYAAATITKLGMVANNPRRDQS